MAKPLEGLDALSIRAKLSAAALPMFALPAHGTFSKATKGRSKRGQRLRRTKRTRAHNAFASSCPLQGANDATTDSISRSGQDPRRRTRGERKMNTESKIKFVRGYTRAYGNTYGKRASTRPPEKDPIGGLRDILYLSRRENHESGHRAVR